MPFGVSSGGAACRSAERARWPENGRAPFRGRLHGQRPRRSPGVLEGRCATGLGPRRGCLERGPDEASGARRGRETPSGVDRRRRGSGRGAAEAALCNRGACLRVGVHGAEGRWRPPGRLDGWRSEAPSGAAWSAGRNVGRSVTRVTASGPSGPGAGSRGRRRPAGMVAAGFGSRRLLGRDEVGRRVVRSSMESSFGAEAGALQPYTGGSTSRGQRSPRGGTAV
jgi:hypothetical protein